MQNGDHKRKLNLFHSQRTSYKKNVREKQECDLISHYIVISNMLALCVLKRSPLINLTKEMNENI